MACRTTRTKHELIRIVRSPAGVIAIDPSGRAPGRGAYLCRDAACFVAAGRRHAIERALGSPLPAEVARTLVAGPEPPEPSDPKHRAAAATGGATPQALTGGPHGQE